MKFGLRHQLFVSADPGAGDAWEFTRRRAQRAEADGFESFWLMDHFYNLPVHGQNVHDPFFDAWTALPALAEATSTARRKSIAGLVVVNWPPILCLRKGL